MAHTQRHLEGWTGWIQDKLLSTRPYFRGAEPGRKVVYTHGPGSSICALDSVFLVLASLTHLTHLLYTHSLSYESYNLYGITITIL